MRVMMKSYMTTAEGVEFKPGDVAEFDDAECERLISVGGARYLTAEDEAAIAAAAATAAKQGPTVAEWVAAGYLAENYPPSGYESRSTAEEIAAAIEAQKKPAKGAK